MMQKFLFDDITLTVYSDNEKLFDEFKDLLLNYQDKFRIFLIITRIILSKNVDEIKKINYCQDLKFSKYSVKRLEKIFSEYSNQNINSEENIIKNRFIYLPKNFYVYRKNFRIENISYKNLEIIYSKNNFDIIENYLNENDVEDYIYNFDFPISKVEFIAQQLANVITTKEYCYKFLDPEFEDIQFNVLRNIGKLSFVVQVSKNKKIKNVNNTFLTYGKFIFTYQNFQNNFINFLKEMSVQVNDLVTSYENLANRYSNYQLGFLKMNFRNKRSPLVITKTLINKIDKVEKNIEYNKSFEEAVEKIISQYSGLFNLVLDRSILPKNTTKFEEKIFEDLKSINQYNLFYDFDLNLKPIEENSKVAKLFKILLLSKYKWSNLKLKQLEEFLKILQLSCV